MDFGYQYRYGSSAGYRYRYQGIGGTLLFRMETVRNFLESSSICGLSHISTSNSKAEKVFWVVVVLASVTMTGYLTTEAFVEWSLYPISTTTETFPITEVTFPRIVVCPPQVGCRFKQGDKSQEQAKQGVIFFCPNLFPWTLPLFTSILIYKICWPPRTHQHLRRYPL